MTDYRINVVVDPRTAEAGLKQIERRLESMAGTTAGTLGKGVAQGFRDAARAATSAYRPVSALQKALGSLGPAGRAAGAALTAMGNAGAVAGQKAIRAIQGISNAASAAASKVGQLMRQFNVVLPVSDIGGAIRAFASLGDTAVRVQNQVRIVTSTQEQFNSTLARLFDIARETRGPIEEISTLYARMSLSAKELGANQERLLNVTTLVGKAVSTSGASSGQLAGALYQLGQAFGSPIIRAEEFNSLQEGLLPILLAVATGIDRFGGSVQKLRAAVVSQNLTNKEFFEGLERGGHVLETMFSKAVPTISSAFISLRNAMIEAITNSDAAGTAIGIVAKGIIFLGQNLHIVIPLVAAFVLALAANAIISSAGAISTLGKAFVDLAGVFARNPVLTAIIIGGFGVAYLTGALDLVIEKIASLTTGLQGVVPPIDEASRVAAIGANEVTGAVDAMGRVVQGVTRDARTGLLRMGVAGGDAGRTITGAMNSGASATSRAGASARSAAGAYNSLADAAERAYRASLRAGGAERRMSPERAREVIAGMRDSARGGGGNPDDRFGAFASGGRAAGGALVGERGPEVVFPSYGSYVATATRTRAMASGGGMPAFAAGGYYLGPWKQGDPATARRAEEVRQTFEKNRVVVKGQPAYGGYNPWYEVARNQGTLAAAAIARVYAEAGSKADPGAAQQILEQIRGVGASGSLGSFLSDAGEFVKYLIGGKEANLGVRKRWSGIYDDSDLVAGLRRVTGKLKPGDYAQAASILGDDAFSMFSQFLPSGWMAAAEGGASGAQGGGGASGGGGGGASGGGGRTSSSPYTTGSYWEPEETGSAGMTGGGGTGGGTSPTTSGGGSGTGGGQPYGPNKGDGRNITIVFNINTPDAESFRRSETQLIAQAASQIQRVTEQM